MTDTAKRVHEHYRKMAEEKKAAEAARPISISLVELEGSEKQIAWAESIRKKIVQDIEEELTNGESGEMLKVALELLEKVVSRRTNAGWWIDGRDISAKKSIEWDLQKEADALMG